MSSAARIGPSLLALLLALAISVAVIALAGANPLIALGALAEGAFGSAEGWSEVGVRTCPLLLAGLAVAVAFRAGIWNIGAEGQLVVGATAVAWLGTHVDALPAGLAVALVLLAAVLAGALWAALAGVLKTARNVDEVISTIMLNFIALGLVGYLVHGPLMEAARNYPQSDAIAAAARLPRLLGGYRVHLGLLVALAAAARRRCCSSAPCSASPCAPSDSIASPRTGGLRHHAHAARRARDQRRPGRSRRRHRGQCDNVPSLRSILAWVWVHRHRRRAARPPATCRRNSRRGAVRRARRGLQRHAAQRRRVVGAGVGHAGDGDLQPHRVEYRRSSTVRWR
jgi:hypothetical protein